MITVFRPLVTIEVSHEFYGGGCPDFRYVVPPTADARLHDARMIARERDGILHVLYEADASGAARVRLDGETLRFGLRLAMPFFANYTQLDGSFPARKLRYTNTADVGALAAQSSVMLVGDLLAHTLTRNSRPATVTLRDASNAVLASETVADDRTTVTFDLRAQPPGALSLRESFANGNNTVPYYHDAELLLVGVSAIVEVTIDPVLYATPAPLEISFDARDDVLRYYVVVRNYTDTEFGQLRVQDLGFAADGRTEIAFTRVAASAFTANELPPELILGPAERVVLFKSQGALARQSRPRRSLQLSRQNQVVIANLPHAGADRASADLIVHVSKP